MGHGLHQALVNGKGILNNILPIPCHTRSGNPDIRTPLIHARQIFPHNGYRVAAVGQIGTVQDLPVFPDHHSLHRGRTSVDPNPGPSLIPLQAPIGNIGLGMAGLKLLILLLIFKQSRQGVKLIDRLIPGKLLNHIA